MESIPKSTLWARRNKEILSERDRLRKSTLDGKLLNLITQSKYRSKSFNRSHDINREFLKNLYFEQQGCCALSGIHMTIIGKRGSDDYWRSISIDRKDSSKGYTKDNVQLVCTGVNYMKKDMSDELFVTFCRNVVEHSK